MVDARAEHKIPIGPEIEDWRPGLDVELPIRIPRLVAWLNWNGFDARAKSADDGHDGFDFAAYLTIRGQQPQCKIVLGLPGETPVRAIANGWVEMADLFRDRCPGGTTYYGSISIIHGSRETGISSEYTHVIPTVEYGQEVIKGETIGKLHRGKGDLTHLHLSLLNSSRALNCLATDPTNVFPELSRFICQPQEELDFEVIGLKPQPRIILAKHNITRY